MPRNALESLTSAIAALASAASRSVVKLAAGSATIGKVDQGAPNGGGTSAWPTTDATISVVDADNSTSDPLGANVTYTGAFKDAQNVPMLGISFKSDVGSATNGAVLEWSRDGVTADVALTATYVAPGMASFYAQKRLRYYRLKYTNGTTAQTTFFLEVTQLPDPMTTPLIPIAASIDDLFVAGLVRSVLTGKVQGGPNDGKYQNVTLNAQGRLNAEVVGTTTGTVAAATTLMVGGKDPSGNAQHILVDASGNQIISTFDRRNNVAATLLNAQPSGTGDAIVQIDGDGTLEQFGYLCRAPSATAVDAASWEVMRLRQIGPASAATATYSRSGTTVTVTLTDHNLLVGDLVYLKSATDTGLNGYQKVVTAPAGSFTFTTASTGTATGTLTVKAGYNEMRYRSGVALTALESGW